MVLKALKSQQNAPISSHRVAGPYCDPSTASEVFLIFITQLYQLLVCLFLFALCSDKPEVFFLNTPNNNTSCCSLPEGSKHKDVSRTSQ